MSNHATDQLHVDRLGQTPLADLIHNIDAALAETVDSEAWQEIPGLSILRRNARHEHYIRCRLGRYHLVFPLIRTLEIGHRPVITALPNLPQWLLGVSNIRGEIVSVVDLASFLEISAGRRKDGGRFVLVYNDNMKTGLIVDSITGLFHLREDDDTIERNQHENIDIGVYVKGVVSHAGETLHILDIDKLLASKRLNQFMGA